MGTPDDTQVCPTCNALRAVLYTWDPQARMYCQRLTCWSAFPIPNRDERTALIRALQTCAQVAATLPRETDHAD